jgi:hypothetical protein
MNFKYKLAESKPHPEEANILRKELDKWNKEWEEDKEKIAKLPKELQDKIKAAAKKALSENKCGGCKPIRK